MFYSSKKPEKMHHGVQKKLQNKVVLCSPLFIHIKLNLYTRLLLFK